LSAVGHLVRWIYRGCARVLIQSEAFAGPVKDMGVPESRILYLPNSAEDIYRPLTPSVWTGPVLASGFRVMFAGNIGAAQSFETILDAAELLREAQNIHWIIVGDGRAMPMVKSEVARRSLKNVHLMGRFPVEQMPAWFVEADVMLATLRRAPIFALTIPSKVQSYMACGRSIIAALDGEGARIVELARAGIGVPAEDPQALADAVEQMSRLSVSEREAMGQRARAYFEEHFSRERLLDRLEGWITDVSREGK